MKRRARGWISRHFDHKLLKKPRKEDDRFASVVLLTHLQGYKRQAVWSPILIVVEVICELLLPLVMAESWIRPSQPATRLTFFSWVR